MVLLAAALWVCGQPGHAGDRVMTNGSLAPAPGCVRGACRPGPGAGARLQGAFLQTAALSVALGPGSAQAQQLRKSGLRAQSRSRRARLPSWYRRAQVAEMRSQAMPAPQLAASVPARARARVREPAVPAAGDRSQGREFVRQGRASSSLAAAADSAPEPAPARVRSAVTRAETRGARHRRLIQESLEELDGEMEMDWEAEAREPRDVPSRPMPDPSATPLGSTNFTSAIKADPSGNYELVEPVTLTTTTDLPLSNASHPFRGTLRGRGSNSLEVYLTKTNQTNHTGGDLHLFEGLANATIDLSVKDSHLVNTRGSVALFGGSTEDSSLALRVSHSTLLAYRGSHAALVEKLGANNNLDVTLSDSRVLVSEPSVGQGPLVAGPVAHTVGQNNSMHVHDSDGNWVHALSWKDGQHSPVVASLGWGQLNFNSSTRDSEGSGFGSGVAPDIDFNRLDDRLEQSNLTNNNVQARVANNNVQARVAGVGGHAHASLAGSYGQRERHGVHRLEQREIMGNNVTAEVQQNVTAEVQQHESAVGLGLASLGLVHDLRDAVHSKGRDAAVFQIRQKGCSGNNVTGAAKGRTEGDQPVVVASLALTTDHSTMPEDAFGHFWIVQNNLSNNSLNAVGDAGRGKAVLVGSAELPADIRHCTNAEPYPHLALFLFSGGESGLPLSIANDSVLRYPSEDRCERSSVIDEAAYSFACNTTEQDCACLRDPGQCPGMKTHGIQVIAKSTDATGWKKVNKAFCETVPALFGEDPLCRSRQSCHNPGEKFHSLLPAGDGEWLLVTRQTWPDGSAGNSASTDLFRLLSFRPQSGQPPGLRGRGLTAHCKSEGQVYTGTRVVPDNGGRVMALASGEFGESGESGEHLFHVYQARDASTQSPLRWTVFSRNATEGCEHAFEVVESVPAGGQLMLLSGSEDGTSGIDVWTRNSTHNGTVERWALSDPEAPRRSYVLALEGESPPLALAYNDTWLYSLHGKEIDDGDVAGWKDFRIQRLRLSDQTAMPDSEWRCVRAQSQAPGRLVVGDAGVQWVPEDGLPFEGSAVLPQVPQEGGCLEWVTQSLAPVTVCSSRTSPAARVSTSTGEQDASAATSHVTASATSGAGAGSTIVLVTSQSSPSELAASSTAMSSQTDSAISSAGASSTVVLFTSPTRLPEPSSELASSSTAINSQTDSAISSSGATSTVVLFRSPTRLPEPSSELASSSTAMNSQTDSATSSSGASSTVMLFRSPTRLPEPSSELASSSTAMNSETSGDTSAVQPSSTMSILIVQPTSSAAAIANLADVSSSSLSTPAGLPGGTDAEVNAGAVVGGVVTGAVVIPVACIALGTAVCLYKTGACNKGKKQATRADVELEPVVEGMDMDVDGVTEREGADESTA